jgi:hypothetical protein
MPQAEWYHQPHFSVLPEGQEKAAEIKYNNHFVIIIPQALSSVNAAIFFLQGRSSVI